MGGRVGREQSIKKMVQLWVPISRRNVARIFCAQQNRIKTVTINALLIFLIGCDDSQTAKIYPLKKVESTDSGHDWLPLNPTIYRLTGSKIISKTGGLFNEYTNCKIMSIDDWECAYSSTSKDTFGFNGGNFWQYPDWNGYKYVSMIEYNLIRCQWTISDKYEGWLAGTARCLFGWE